MLLNGVNVICMNPTNRIPEPDQLIHNLEFVEWVINPTNESDLFWAQYISTHQSQKKEIEEAIFIVRKIISKEKKLADKDIQRLWEKIEIKVDGRKIHYFPVYRWIAAAGVILLIGLSAYFYSQKQKEEKTVYDYQSLAKIETPDNDVKLILADKSEKLLNSKEPDIKYNSNGELIVNSNKYFTLKQSVNESISTVNQLIVPNGRRTSLTLSDGTKLWLNSGSRTIFPVVFSDNKREIFLEGEAYLEVAHDNTKPFFVVTNNMKIKVLGTKFDVSAYSDDAKISVVLVDGSVKATIDTRETVMKPNQLLTYHKDSKETSLEQTDVLSLISWKDGWLYCDKENLDAIAAKLSRYYNVKIEFEDNQAKEMSLTGKLDLKGECSEVFKAISTTAPILYVIDKNEILISTKRTD